VVGVVVSILIILESLDQLFLAHITCAITTFFFLSLHLICIYVFFLNESDSGGFDFG